MTSSRSRRRHGRRLPRRQLRTRTHRSRLRSRARVHAYRQSAQQRLRRFRQGSILAVAFTGLFLMLWGVPAAPAQQAGDSAAAVAGTPDSAPVVDTTEAEPGSAVSDPGRSVDEATGTVRDLVVGFTDLLPKLLIALALLIAAAVIVRLVRTALRTVLGEWERAEAATAMSGVVIWLIAVGAALSVVAGDARALVGSVGLLGLALSWALQAPIESFAAWLLNSFKGYYRVGDRIAVGEVFGDVYRIDFLNTTVWEAGGPDKPVRGAQPTGALITFPNSEVLRANVINYTRGFPFVWDELVIGISNESDLTYAMDVIGDVARRVIGPAMAEPAATYREILDREGLAYDVAGEPVLFVSATESWTDITVRYLVGARERRKWSSTLLIQIDAELKRPEHRDRIQGSYPVRRVDMNT